MRTCLPFFARPFCSGHAYKVMKSQVFEDEVLAGAESAEHPPEEMPERQDHSKNIIGEVRINHGAKSFILCV